MNRYTPNVQVHVLTAGTTCRSIAIPPRWDVNPPQGTQAVCLVLLSLLGNVLDKDNL